MALKKLNIKTINNADSFSQPSLIIVTKGANIFGHDCIYLGMKIILMLWERIEWLSLTIPENGTGNVLYPKQMWKCVL